MWYFLYIPYCYLIYVVSYMSKLHNLGVADPVCEDAAGPRVALGRHVVGRADSAEDRCAVAAEIAAVAVFRLVPKALDHILFLLLNPEEHPLQVHFPLFIYLRNKQLIYSQN